MKHSRTEIHSILIWSKNYQSKLYLCTRVFRNGNDFRASVLTLIILGYPPGIRVEDKFFIYIICSENSCFFYMLWPEIMAKNLSGGHPSYDWKYYKRPLKIIETVIKLQLNQIKLILNKTDLILRSLTKTFSLYK